MMNIDEYKQIVQNELEKYFDEQKKNSKYSSTIWEAMSYTTLLPGKKLRAIFCLETAKLLCGDYNLALPCACAIEMLHAQSLIHDDLPCMDNDDLRRGKPSNHKVYGEAMAVLAGDALISFGAQTIIEKTPKSVGIEKVLEVVKLYMHSAGALGIVAGQCADMEAEKNVKNVDYENLKYIHTYKTAKLFEFSILSGAILAGADIKTLDKLKEFANTFGLAFQAYDDILDVICTTEEMGKTVGKDEKEAKATYVSLFGLNDAKSKFNELIAKSHDILKEIGLKSQIYNDILDKMFERVN